MMLETELRGRCGALRAGVAALLIMGASILGTAAEAADTVRYGLQRGAMGALKQVLPEVDDEFNIDYEISIFNDATSVILAMEQKELDIGNITAQHLVRAIDEGLDIVLVAGWGGGYNVLAADDDLGLDRDDLAGLKALAAERKAAGDPLTIGVPTGSQQHLKLTYALTRAGIDPERDVSVVNIPFPNHIRAMGGDEVDMVMTLAPLASLIVSQDAGEVFHHVYGGENGTWEIGFAVRRDMVDNQPDLVQRIVDSHVEAMGRFVDDVDKQVELEMQESNFPQPVVDMTQREFLRLTHNMVVEDIKRTARQMHEVGWAKADHSEAVEDHVDFRFLEKATGKPKSELTKPGT